jgi:hypothetical protein
MSQFSQTGYLNSQRSELPTTCVQGFNSLTSASGPRSTDELDNAPEIDLYKGGYYEYTLE